MTDRRSVTHEQAEDLARRVKLIARFFPIERIGIVAPSQGNDFRIFISAKGLEDPQ